MPPITRSRKRDSAEAASAPTILSQEKSEKIELFLDYFDKEANSRILSMEQKFVKILDMVDRVMAVHLLKIPVAIQRMKFKDFLGETDQAAAIAAAVTDNPEEYTIATLPRKTTKKKIKPLKPLSVSTSALSSDQLKFKAKSSAAKHRTLQKIPQNNTKSDSASKKKALFTSTPISNVKTPAVPRKTASEFDKRLLKMPKSGRKALTCSPVRVDKSQPFINIPLADGKAIYAVGGEVDNIDVESLDPNTLTCIQSLVIHLTALCEKANYSVRANSI
uniref:Borealin-2 n=1 Tax=Callorhinchus milii TaxID=7868 RepID=V9L865_CALMI